MRDGSWLFALGAILASCGGKAPGPAAPVSVVTTSGGVGAVPAAGASGARLLYEVSPSRLLPELVGQRGVVATEEGQQRVLVDGMRLVARADGSLERADELFSRGTVASIALPSRLGGGYVFHVSAGGSSSLWRAHGWLDKLKPLARVSDALDEIIPGFDRLYARVAKKSRVLAFDPVSGAALGVGPLPTAGSYGALAFADGWRAVVDTDLRGPLATFDAGVTWRPLDLHERPLGVGIVDGDPAVLVPGGRYAVDARGGVTRRADTRASRSDEPASSVEARRPGPLGRRPLRAAVEDGWPDSATSAVVARGGALARVSLHDGAVLALVEDAYPERRASCHAARLGLHGIGFLCGEREGATVVYELVPPLALKPVLRFDKPRFVEASGNGALVIKGRCDGDGALDGASVWYCVRSPQGVTREVSINGEDRGIERVVGLGDGRIAVLVPPRDGDPGSLSIIASGGHVTKTALQIPAEPAGVAREIKRGLWLDGFEERAPGVLGGWIESGGPVVGVEIGLDGVLKPGELQGEGSGAIFGGRFAVILLDGQRALETRDGGMIWSSFDLPDRPDEARAVPDRGVGPVGAALPGWIRVGWGDAEAPDDLKPAAEPRSLPLDSRVSPTLALDCEVGAPSTPPLPDKPKPPAPARVAPSPPRRVHGAVPVVAAPAHSARPVTTPQLGWYAFRNTLAPALGPDESGVDNGSAGYDTVPLRAYVWGRKGADWSRTGRWLIRFDDRFDPAGGLRAAALTASQWTDEATALEALGSSVNSYNAARWEGILDPSGRALLASVCRGSTLLSCALYAVGDGQPVLPLRDPSGRAGGFNRPVTGGAVRVGEAWFFLAQSPSNDALQLWRADLGSARLLGSYFRSSPLADYAAPRLVRRALGGGVGLLVVGSTEASDKYKSWFVLPADPDTGALGEAVALGRRDFAGVSLSRCAPEQDGWVLDAAPENTATVSIEADNARAQFDDVELRVRLDPGRACVEAVKARSGAFYATGPAAGPGPAVPITSAPAKKGGAPEMERSIPLAATEKNTGRRWALSCRIKPRS